MYDCKADHSSHKGRDGQPGIAPGHGPVLPVQGDQQGRRRPIQTGYLGSKHQRRSVHMLHTHQGSDHEKKTGQKQQDDDEDGDEMLFHGLSPISTCICMCKLLFDLRQ